MDLFYWFKRNTGTVLWFSQTEIQTRCYVVIKLKTEKLTLFFQGGLELIERINLHSQHDSMV